MPEPESPAVRLNEILPVPAGIDWNSDGLITQSDAWLELYNASDEVIDISGWQLEFSDGEYQIPAGTKLQPGSYLVLFPLQAGESLEDGGNVRLLNREHELVERIKLPKMAPDASYSRDSNGNWHDDWPPTPGQPNGPQQADRQQLPGLPPLP